MATGRAARSRKGVEPKPRIGNRIDLEYHEHPTAEPLTRKDRATGAMRPRIPRDRYVEVTEAAGLFDRPDWLAEVWATPIEQVWRGHLLALACQQDHRGWDPARYVLVAPSANPAWPALANEYLAFAPGASATFEFRGLEQLIDQAEDLLPHARAFRSRYLDVAVADR
jgi:hypothetical protein